MERGKMGKGKAWREGSKKMGVEEMGGRRQKFSTPCPILAMAVSGACSLENIFALRLPQSKKQQTSDT